MKLPRTLIALVLLCSVVWAQEVILAPVLPEVKVDRTLNAYAESITKPVPVPKRPLVTLTPITPAAIKQLKPLNQEDLRKSYFAALDPEFGYFGSPVEPSKLEKTKQPSFREIIAKGEVWRPAKVEALRPLSSFRVKILARWNPPHGEMMQTMLSQIEAAEKAGDSETYQRLTATYTTWAEKYLVRDTKSELKQNP
jgi:hypothetical protein